MKDVRGKIWGSTNCIFAKNNVEIHRIEIKKGGYCSLHKHIGKWNLFYVEQGRIEVRIDRSDANVVITDKTVLCAGDSTYVEPGQYHQFLGLEDSVVFEVYWTELFTDDIVRKTVGGRQE